MGLTVGALIVALACIAQGVYVLKTGIITFFLFRPSSSVPRRAFPRVGCGAFYICCGLWILAVLLHAPLRGSLSIKSLAEWMRVQWDTLIIGVLFSGAGVMLLARPAIGVSWARAAYPEVSADDKRALLIIRIVAAMMLGLAIIILASILRPVSSG